MVAAVSSSIDVVLEAHRELVLCLASLRNIRDVACFIFVKGILSVRSADSLDLNQVLGSLNSPSLGGGLDSIVVDAVLGEFGFGKGNAETRGSQTSEDDIRSSRFEDHGSDRAKRIGGGPLASLADGSAVDPVTSVSRFGQTHVARRDGVGILNLLHEAGRSDFGGLVSTVHLHVDVLNVDGVFKVTASSNHGNLQVVVHNSVGGSCDGHDSTARTNFISSVQSSAVLGTQTEDLRTNGLGTTRILDEIRLGRRELFLSSQARLSQLEEPVPLHASLLLGSTSRLDGDVLSDFESGTSFSRQDTSPRRLSNDHMVCCLHGHNVVENRELGGVSVGIESHSIDWADGIARSKASNGGDWSVWIVLKLLVSSYWVARSTDSG